MWCWSLWDDTEHPVKQIAGQSAPAVKDGTVFCNDYLFTWLSVPAPCAVSEAGRVCF